MRNKLLDNKRKRAKRLAQLNQPEQQQQQQQHTHQLFSAESFQTTPVFLQSTPFKLKEGLKELSVHLYQDISPFTLPSTLEHLSILNSVYDNRNLDNCLPLSLTSLEVWSSHVRLDLSRFNSIKLLKVFADTLISYPRNLEKLTIIKSNGPYSNDRNNDQFFDYSDYNTSTTNQGNGSNLSFNNFNNNSIRELNVPGYFFEKLVKHFDLCNLKYLKTDTLSQDTILPKSLETLVMVTIPQRFITPNLKHIQTGLNSSTLDYFIKSEPKIINDQPIKQLQQLEPQVDPFFVLFRNIFLKSRILGALSRSYLKYNNETGTLNQIDKFPYYNIIIDKKENLDNVRNFTPDEVYIEYKGILPQLLSFIPRSARKLVYHHTPNNQIPPWITHLTLLTCDHIAENDIPASVTHLTVRTRDPSSPLTEYAKRMRNHIPTNLSKLNGKIPSTVTHLTLKNLKEMINFSIPASITHLTLLDHPINDIDRKLIPSTIKSIKFIKLSFKPNVSINPYIFERIVQGVFFIYSPTPTAVSNNTTYSAINLNNLSIYDIPNNTTHLFWSSDRVIDDQVSIPKSVHTLIVRNALVKSIPSSITRIIFPEKLNNPLSHNSFPTTVKSLSLNRIDETIKEKDLPKELTHLTLNRNGQIESLPKTLEYLDYRKSILFHDYEIKIPEQVKHVKIKNKKETKIPSTVQSIRAPNSKLEFPTDYKFNTKEKIEFPPSTSLHLGALFFKDFIKPNSLLDSIKTIRIDRGFNQPLVPGIFPDSVETLELGLLFNQRISKELLPKHLKTLMLGDQFNQEINNNSLPDSLTELILNTLTKPLINFTVSPPGLKKLACPYFNGLLDKLPNTVNHLEFTSVFNDRYLGDQIKEQEALKKENEIIEKLLNEQKREQDNTKNHHHHHRSNKHLSKKSKYDDSSSDSESEETESSETDSSEDDFGNPIINYNNRNNNNNNNYYYNYRSIYEFPISIIPSNITRLALCKGMMITSSTFIPPTIKSLTLFEIKHSGKIPTTVESITLSNFLNQPLQTILQTN